MPKVVSTLEKLLTILSLNCPMKILNLSNLIDKNIYITEDITNFDIQMLQKPHKYPCYDNMIHCIHDYCLQKIKDLPSLVKKVTLFYKGRHICL